MVSTLTSTSSRAAGLDTLRNAPAIRADWLSDKVTCSGSQASSICLSVLECTLLVLGMVVVGAIVVPAHWTSIWMDREFTGWVAPIANRVSHGLKLYGAGGHSPMPPLPFVLLQVVGNGQATWMTESLTNVVFQSLMLLTMFWALMQLFPRPIPFLATFAAFPLTYALPKTIVYDSIPQFLVALLGVLTIRFLKVRSRLCLILLAAATALCLLSKQSTGGGAYLGMVIVMCLLSPEPLRARLRSAVVYSAWTGILLGAITLALAPAIHIPGMFHDVFLAGSEPKGGALRLLKNLAIYAVQIGQQLAIIVVTVAAVVGMSARRVAATASADVAEIRDEPPPSGWCLYVACLLAPPCLLLFQLQPYKLTFLQHGCANIVEHFLWVGLLIGLLWTAQVLFPGRLPAIRLPSRLGILAALFVLFFMGALCHSLSGARFRWTYDNNPLIVFAIATMLWLAQQLWQRVGGGLGQVTPVVGFGLVFCFQCLLWATFAKQYAACAQCTEAWPEVSHLAGARLMPAAAGMHHVTALVRQLASETDTVLLLPEDPNVQAWFERQRPELSSPIIFADQYWDRYVDEDVAALRNQLPRVIVMGPKRYWRDFQRIWNKDYGTERLIDRVAEEILPAHYELHTSLPIQHCGKVDVMEIYVRKPSEVASRNSVDTP